MISSGVQNVSTSLVHFYYDMKDWTWDSPYAPELEWQHSVTPRGLSGNRFLSEYAWVVLNSGFRESVVRRLFPDISSAFLYWIPESISEQRDIVLQAALKVFKNRKKIESILEGCLLVSMRGTEWIEVAINDGDFAALCQMPFIGPITCKHLAKNLGAHCCKHDRHLVRLAHELGFLSPDLLCNVISEETGDPVGVVDYVLWRSAAFASDTFAEIAHSQSVSRAWFRA
jgi:hypothetical protein